MAEVFPERPPGHVEAIYADMPRFGLAAATGHVPVRPGRGTAQQRLAAAVAGSDGEGD